MSDRWRALRLQRDDLQVTLLPGIGGRLWDVTFEGQSILFQNPDLVGVAVDDAQLHDLPTRSPQFGFPLWGGEKTWIAPDTAWANDAPFPLLDSGAYAVTSQDDTYVEMASVICPLSHLSITRRVTVVSANRWMIDHHVTNHGDRTRPTGIWSVMMLDTPTTIGVALDSPEYEPVFGAADGMVSTYTRGVVAACTRQQEFKIGLPNPDGTTVIRAGKEGRWVLCSTATPEKHEVYAHRHPVEIFNSGDYSYCEAEWHSPLCALAPQQTMHFSQTFDIFSHAQAVNELKRHKELVTCMS